MHQIAHLKLGLTEQLLILLGQQKAGELEQHRPIHLL
jgi:hypothetical protein